MDEMFEQFLVEGRDLVAEAHAGLIALGRSIGDRKALDSLFRATHTLKGSVALFDMAPSEQLLHAAENHLDAVRKDRILLDGDSLDALVAVIDQTDRWIDAMAEHGALDDHAPETAARIAALLQSKSAVVENAQSSRAIAQIAGADGDPDWLPALRSRLIASDIKIDGTMTAFRYMPDPECFFRGEDPLALAATIPKLLALHILPAGETWSELCDYEPFQCQSVIEGVSGISEDQLRATLRLVSDQVGFFPLTRPDAAFSATPQADTSQTTAVLRVDAAKLDRLALESGDLGVAARALGPLIARVHTLDPVLAADIRAAQDEIERVVGGLQRSIAQVRLVSIEPVLRRLPRLVRETAVGLGKSLRFHLSGETTQVDKQIADRMFEPLLHLVRNAVDHGIETPEDRRRAGKNLEGSVSLSVRREGERVFFTLADDGRGIDPAAMRETAVRKGLVAPADIASIDDADALRLVFLPGFSTASTVTGVSGRGVGMDAVKASVERLAGTVKVSSVIGKGTRIELSLPIHAISTPLLVVSAGGEDLGIRLDQITEISRIAASEIQPLGSGRACVLRNATVPVIDLAASLGLGEALGEQARLLITEVNGSRVALRVDTIGERFSGVLRDRVGLLCAMPAIAATAQRADGTILLVLDLPEIVV